jgi:hypothetical protein
LLSLMISIIIALVGVVLKLVIRLLSKFESAQSNTELHYKIARKLWKMQFINMAIVPLVISISMLNFFDIGGLQEEVRVIFIVNAIVPHAVELVLNFEWYFKMLRLWWIERFIKTGKGGIYHQKQANSASEGLDFKISEFYSYLFSTLGSALFYLPIFPVNIGIAILSFVCGYWT